MTITIRPECQSGNRRIMKARSATRTKSNGKERAKALEPACAAFRRGEVTLSRAAELAGVGVREMLLRIPQAGLELHYGIHELEEDMTKREATSELS